MSSKRPRPPKPLAEHSPVVAVRDIAEHGTVIPKGAVGTIVHVVRDGLGYDVEFTTPIHAVVTATREDLAPADKDESPENLATAPIPRYSSSS